MHHGRPNPANRRWWAAVFLVAVAAFIVVRIFRPVHPEEKKTEEPEQPTASLISTQVLSFRLDGNAELDSVADDSGSIWLGKKPERPGALIVPSDPSAAQMEAYKRERDFVPRTETTESQRGEEIKVE
jgi:hypothetical protein